MFQGTIIRNEPAFRPRPEVVPEYHKFSHGHYDAFVAVSALEHIAHDARETAPNEAIGFLVGRPFRDDQGPYAIVSDAITAASARRGPVTVETSFDDELRLVNILLTTHPTCEKLGWYHSHPFSMPSYSGPDAENQRFWNEPYHLGLLACMDRGSRTVTIYAFRGPEGEPLSPPYVSRIDAAAQLAALGPVPEEVLAATVNRAAILPLVGKRRPERGNWMRWAAAIAAAIIWSIMWLVGVWWVVERAVGKLRQGNEWPASAVPAVVSQQTPDGSANNAAATWKDDGTPRPRLRVTTKGQVSEIPKDSLPTAAKK